MWPFPPSAQLLSARLGVNFVPWGTSGCVWRHSGHRDRGDASGSEWVETGDAANPLTGAAQPHNKD